jgi:hypothetical protein
VKGRLIEGRDGSESFISSSFKMERITNTKATVVVATKVPAKKIIDCWLDGFKMKPHNFMKFR